MGKTLTDARLTAYEAISSITLRGGHYRGDIALAASSVDKVREN
jgi:phosphoribosylamine-glycine ligase